MHKRNFLSFGCTVEAHFGNTVLMDWVHNAKRPTKFSILRVAIKHLYVSALLQAAMLLACHRGYVFFSMKDV